MNNGETACDVLRSLAVSYLQRARQHTDGSEIKRTDSLVGAALLVAATAVESFSGAANALAAIARSSEDIAAAARQRNREER